MFFLSPLLVFLKDQASSHLIDTIIQLAHKSLLRDLYKNHLRGQLVDLALHRIANFPVQRLAAASAKLKLVGVSVAPLAAAFASLKHPSRAADVVLLRSSRSCLTS